MIEVEELEYCKVSVSYNAEPEKVRLKRSEALDAIFKESKKIAIPGWSKGKATRDIVRIKYKDRIEQNTRKEMESLAYEDILFETKIKPIFYPQKVSDHLTENSYECKMIFQKKPDFELKQYKGLEVPKPHVGTTAAELSEKIIQDIRLRFGETLPYAENDFIQTGDKVSIAITCTVNDKQIDEYTKEGHFYEVGSNFYPEFDDGILGMSLEETRSFQVKWGDSEDKATFTVKLNMGVKLVPAALDDALAQKIGSKDMEEVRQKAQGAATNQISRTENSMIGQQIVSRLLSEHDFQLPSWLVSMEAQSLAAQNQVDWKTIDDDTKSKINELAHKQVKLSLIMDSIREVEPETQFSETEMLNMLRTRVAESGQDPNKFLVEAQRTGRLFGIIASHQHEMILDWLVKQTTIKE